MSSNDDRLGMTSPDMSFRDWIHAAPQWGPRHIWGHTRSIASGVLLDRTVKHPDQRKLLGLDVRPSTTDRVINTGRVSTLRGRLILGALATALTPFYFVYAVMTTIGMELSTRIADYNIVEAKERAQRKALKKAVKAGQQARDAGQTADQVMADQIASATAHPKVASFRTVCVPCTVAERAAITAQALQAAQAVRDGTNNIHLDNGNPNPPRNEGLN